MIMNDAGSALMGTGEGNGEQRATSAARKAVSSPLLESPIDGARGILLSITGSSNLTLNEVNEAAELVLGVAHPDANIIFGTERNQYVKQLLGQLAFHYYLLL